MIGDTLNISHVIRPLINWNIFVKHTYEILGRSITQKLDERAAYTGDYNVRDVKAYLSMLSEMCSPGMDLHAVLKNSRILDHLSYSFLVSGDIRLLVDIIINTDLKALPADDKIVLLTGTLSQWKRAVQAYLILGANPVSREFYTNIYHFFGFEGLSDLWPSVTSAPDGTLLMTN